MIAIMLETFPSPLPILYYIFCLWEEKILRFLIIQHFDVNWKRFLFKITRVSLLVPPSSVFPRRRAFIPGKARKKNGADRSVPFFPYLA
jgi:hypothetical protein